MISRIYTIIYISVIFFICNTYTKSSIFITIMYHLDLTPNFYEMIVGLRLILRMSLIATNIIACNPWCLGGYHPQGVVCCRSTMAFNLRGCCLQLGQYQFRNVGRWRYPRGHYVFFYLPKPSQTEYAHSLLEGSLKVTAWCSQPSLVKFRSHIVVLP
jgi:hypothetical protein